jgi:hypothetical protein
VKTNDIYICAFPKSGITYFSFLLAAARLRHNKIAMVPTIYNIDFLVIDIHKMGNTPPGEIWHDGLGNFFKNHKGFSALPNVVFLLRDPVDTLKSYYHFRKRLGSADTVLDFLAGPEGIQAWTQHARSWLLDNRLASQSIFVTQYESVLADPAAELRLLANQFGITFSEETIAFSVAAAGIENMRRLEKEFTDRNPVYRQFDLDFVRKTERREIEGFTPEVIALIETHTRPVYEAIKARIGH